MSRKRIIGLLERGLKILPELRAGAGEAALTEKAIVENVAVKHRKPVAGLFPEAAVTAALPDQGLRRNFSTPPEIKPLKIKPALPKGLFSLPPAAELTKEEMDEALDQAFNFKVRLETHLSSGKEVRKLDFRKLGVRHFSTFSRDGEPKIEDVCTWYREIPNPQNDPAINEYNRLASILKFTISSLANDGFHRGSRLTEDGFSGRAGVISAYHRAHLAAARHLLKEDEVQSKTAFDDKVEIACIDSDDPKAIGHSIFAQIDGISVGGMFMANHHEGFHLTLLSASRYDILRDKGIDSVDLQVEMLRSFFNDRNLSEDEFNKLMNSHVRISCVADYRGLLIELANRQGTLATNPMFEFVPLDDDDAEYGFPKDIEHANIKRNIRMCDLASLVGCDRYVACESPKSVVQLADYRQLSSPTTQHQNTV